MAEDFEAPLSEVATQLKQNPDMVVVLEGHTDSVGDAAYNIQLGEKRNSHRAVATTDWIIGLGRLDFGQCSQ